MKRVLFTGGGTGGHIYPALAIREILLKRFPEMVSGYLGLSDGMEAGIIKRLPDIPFLPVRAQGMPRTPSLKWFSFPLVNMIGFFEALSQIREFKPDLLVSTGGYVAFPALLAATVLGIPFVIHEQNAAMGVTNRLFAGRAARILLTYSEAYAESSDRVIFVGNPVRQAFLDAPPAQNRFKKNPGISGFSWSEVRGGH